MSTIVDLFKAPIIKCEVVEKESGEVYYKGDSSYEANAVYNAMLKANKQLKYTKEVLRLVDQWDVKKYNEMGLHAAAGQLLPKLPERIQKVYISVLAGNKIDNDVLSLTQQLHPEWFNPTIQNKK